MIESLDIPHWPALLRPLSLASTALGRLAHALETTPFIKPSFGGKLLALPRKSVSSMVIGYKARS